MIKSTASTRRAQAIQAKRGQLQDQQGQSGGVQAFGGVGGDGGPRSALNTRWAARPRSANADTVRALPRQRAESRELVRSHPIAAGAVETNVNRVVGTGLVPVPMPDAELLGMSPAERAAWCATLAREWAMWSDSTECIHGGDGNETFYLYQRMALEARLVSGDCITLLPDAASPTPTMPYRLRLQMIEADRLGNPSGQVDTDDITQGVMLRDGQPSAYYIYDRHPGSATTGGADKYAGRWVDRVGSNGRRNVLHHLRRHRPEQSRGVPYLATVQQAIKDLGRYTEAEITAAVISAYYTVFVTRAPTAGGPPIDGMSPASAGDVPAPGPEMALDVGAIVGLADGEDVKFADPNRPNAAYADFVRAMYGEIAVGLHMPRSLLLKVFDASYSASRAELLDAWQNFRAERQWLQISLCQPVYETWLAEAVALGRIVAPGFFDDPLIRWAYCRADWYGDSQGSLNPKDEVAAYSAAIDARLMTYERAEWELFGTSWAATFGQKTRELESMRTAGIMPAPKAGAAVAPATSPAPAGATA